MGRHRGSKARTADAALEQRWRRLQAAGRVAAHPGAKDPPWLDAETLRLQAIGAVEDCAGYTCPRAERETLCELAVHACERGGTGDAMDVEHLASAIVAHRLDEALSRELLQRLAAAYPAAKIVIR